MKRRHVLALMGALLMLMLELVSYPFILSGASSVVQYVFFAPALLGERFLLFARDSLGWPVASGFRTSLSDGWSLVLLFFNVFCYVALGFLAGLRLGDVLWKER
jgi:hypothetical protein